MTFAEFRQNLFKVRAEVYFLSSIELKGIAVSRVTWEAIHPDAVQYVMMFNLPCLLTASRAIFLDNVQIFLVDEPDIFCPILELSNLTHNYNGPNKQREMA